VHADEKLTAFVELGDTWNFLKAIIITSSPTGFFSPAEGALKRR
jgi:hypothetical protein